MNDYYLKSANKEEFEAALDAGGFIEEWGLELPVGTALDIIGVIRAATGNTLTDEDGFEYPEMEPVPGYHANYRGDELPEALAELEIPAPDNPVRVWA